MRTRSSVKDLDSMGLNDGLGTDFLSTKWTTPTVEEAEQFQKMNMFEGGNATTHHVHEKWVNILFVL